MICHSKNCNHDFGTTEPTIVLMGANKETGKAFWGYFCSYSCMLSDVLEVAMTLDPNIAKAADQPTEQQTQQAVETLLSPVAAPMTTESDPELDALLNEANITTEVIDQAPKPSIAFAPGEMPDWTIGAVPSDPFNFPIAFSADSPQPVTPQIVVEPMTSEDAEDGLNTAPSLTIDTPNEFSPEEHVTVLIPNLEASAAQIAESIEQSIIGEGHFPKVGEQAEPPEPPVSAANLAFHPTFNSNDTTTLKYSPTSKLSQLAKLYENEYGTLFDLDVINDIEVVTPDNETVTISVGKYHLTLDEHEVVSFYYSSPSMASSGAPGYLGQYKAGGDQVHNNAQWIFKSNESTKINTALLSLAANIDLGITRVKLEQASAAQLSIDVQPSADVF